MRYMLLIYGSEADTSGMTPEERIALMQAHAAFANEAQQRGLLTGGAPLQSTSTATTVRVRNGKTLITDGPFAETKEQLAGTYVLNSETPSNESRGVLAEISTLPKILEGSAALVLSRQDCGPTRSNSRNTEAAQEAPRARMFSGVFQGGRQARLHALPVNAQLAPGREGESDGIEHARQPR